MCVLLFLFSVPAKDDELVTETSLSLLPEAISKNTNVLPSGEKMNGGVDGERKGRCVCVCLCAHMLYAKIMQFLSSVHLVFTSTVGMFTASQKTYNIHTHVHTNMRVLSIQQFTVYVCACKYVHVVVVDYREEAQRESTSASLINQKHYSGSTPVSDC